MRKPGGHGLAKQSQENPEKQNVPVATTGEQPPELVVDKTEDTDGGLETYVLTGHGPKTAKQNRAPKIQRSETDLRGEVVSGKYSIEEKLGEGGMGSVYQAFDGLMKRTVAIKLLNQDREITEDSWKRFHQEAQATSQLDHPNIVRIYDFNVCQTHGPYLVMDLIEGEPLSSLIARKGALEPQFVADLMVQVADALQHAHDKGIIHRDLKPSNILVSAEVGQKPVAKVVDFGIAKLQGPNAEDLRLTKTGEVFGSPLYMSPEQCLAAPLDRRSDIYALGCVMYEALCGEPPFRGKNFGDTVIKHTKETPKPFASDLQIPKSIKSIVFCALEKAPADRYQSMAALRKELTNFKMGQFVRVKQKRRFWKLALIVCLATIPITTFFSFRDAVRDNPEFISSLFLRYQIPQIFEWFILPDDETRIALNSVKIAMQDMKQHKFEQAADLLKGTIDANPGSNRFRRMTAWPLARALARQGKYDEAYAFLKQAYSESDHQLGDNLRIVGITLKLHDGQMKNSRFFFEKGIEAFTRAKETYNAAVCEYFLGTCQLESGQLVEARKTLEAAQPKLKDYHGKDIEKNKSFIEKCQTALKELDAKEKGAPAAAPKNDPQTI